jgi:hypothetical protein
MGKAEISAGCSAVSSTVHAWLFCAHSAAGVALSTPLSYVMLLFSG